MFRSQTFRLILIASLLSVFPAEAFSQAQYVKDVVFVPLRSGPSSKHRILHKGLKSGTKVQLVSAEETDGFLNVQTERGLVGWLPKHYLSGSPTAALLLVGAQNKLQRFETENTALTKETRAQAASLRKLKKSALISETAKQQVTMELHRIRSISSGAIELDEKYQSLLENYELLQTTNDTLNAENQGLKSERQFSYMFYGAMLVIIGMLMAVILPRLKMKKRHSEWSN